MEKRLKKLTALGMIVVMTAIAGLTGCSKTETPETSATTEAKTEEAKTEEQTDDGAEQEILTWSVWDLDASVYYVPLVEAFEAANPNIKVELLDLGSTEYMTVLGTQLSGGDSTIDIATIKDIPGYMSLVDKGQLDALGEYTKDLDLSMYNGAVEQMEINGEFYGLPFRSDYYIMYYNKDLFDAAGVAYPGAGITFEEYDSMIREVSEKATEARGEQVYGGHYHTWRSQVQLYGLLDGENTLVSDDYSFLNEIYDTILAQQNDGIVHDYATLKTASLHYSAAFYQNNVASTIMGTWFIPTLAKAIASGESENFNWGLAPMPITSGAQVGATAGTVTTLAINANSNLKESAYKFIEFVCGPEGAKIVAGTGTMPAIPTEEVIALITAVDGFPTDAGTTSALTDITAIFLELPVKERVSEVETILNDAHDNIMTGNAVPAEEFKMASEEVKALGIQ
jgi:ABC-type sugar transport system, periplasmic component